MNAPDNHTPDAFVLSLLGQLGITANYKGYFITGYAVLLALDDPQRLTAVTKLLYPTVARHFGIAPCSVERNIRTVVSIAALTNPELLRNLLGPGTQKIPSPGTFIAALAAHCAQAYPSVWAPLLCVNQSLFEPNHS